MVEKWEEQKYVPSNQCNEAKRGFHGNSTMKKYASDNELEVQEIEWPSFLILQFFVPWTFLSLIFFVYSDYRAVKNNELKFLALSIFIQGQLD